MAHEMRRKTHCKKAEMKRVMSESYECLPREREKVNMNSISGKMKIYIA